MVSLRLGNHMRAAAALTVAAAMLLCGAIAWAADGESARADQREIHVPGSTAVLTLWDQTETDGSVVPYYSISLNGHDVVRTAPASYELGLRYQRFDPLLEEPSVPEGLRADNSGKLFIVQFVTPPLEVYADQIAGLGGAVRHYIAQFAYLVEMTPETRDAVERLPYVRWVGPYHPAYRLEEFMLDNLQQAEQAYPLLRYNIEVLSPDQKSVVADRIARIGGQVDRADGDLYLVQATLTPEQLYRVVRFDEVNFVDRWGPMEEDMDLVRQIGGANYIETAAGYTGAGVRGEVFDAGFNLGHHDFQSRPLIEHGITNSESHGASTSGICFGDGAGQWMARGMLPEGQGIVADYDYFGLSGTGRYNETLELTDWPYQAVFQTSSVGSPRTTQYTTISAETDARLLASGLAACQSQSNAGNQNSRPEAWAKNIISGGGVYHYNNTNFDDDCWCYGASIGPASDGRIKPTLCSFYDLIYTTTCCGYESYTSGFNGTSAATPIIAGHLGLFFQMWADGIFGNDVDPEGSVFDNRAHMTTAKAMMVNTARQYPFSGSTHDKTRMHQGWGLPDLQNMYDMREKIYVVDESRLLKPFQVDEHTLLVEPDEPAFKATMTYPDTPGNPSVQSQHRINDLTMRVVSPTGTVYYGNQGLLTGNWSVAGGSADTKNTVECVYVQNPEPGEWTVEIHADELIQDTEPGTVGIDSRYALVVSGVQAIDISDVDGNEHPGSALGLVLAGPNPASRTAHLKLSLSREEQVRVAVYDTQGRLVATLFNGRKPAGIHQIAWDGTATNGAQVEPGVYFVRVTMEGGQATQKLLIVR